MSSDAVGMTPEISVSARDLGKAFRLYRRPEDRLKQLLPRLSRNSREAFWALRNVNLELRRGETLGVLGANGAGKSTLLHLICGTLQPTTGSVAVNGRVAALLGLGAGFHPQFTGRENVRLKAAALGLSKDQISERMDSIAQFAGIGEFLDLPVRLYSSGMYARLAFAVCAHVDADILIIDEILAVGDSAFRKKCTHFLDRFREKGTVLFVSHSGGTVTEICERALWLEHGRMREIGPAAEVSVRYLASLSGSAEDAPEFRAETRSDRWLAPPPPPLARDFRHRNCARMRISEFDSAAPSHGFGGIAVEEAGFFAADGARLAEMQGGDEVELRIYGRAARDISKPIMGFILRDRFGQNVFGDNTYMSYRDAAPTIRAGETIEGAFRFQLPNLARGDYGLTVAFVEGTQEDHVHLQWIEDALILSVVESPVTRGIVALPASSIRFELSPNESSIPVQGNV